MIFKSSFPLLIRARALVRKMLVYLTHPQNIGVSSAGSSTLPSSYSAGRKGKQPC